jgi:hypothetical protein
MTNNKQQTAVDLFAERTFNLIELMKRKWVNQEEFLDGILKARNEAKEIEKKRIIKAWKAGDGKYDKVADKLAEQYYNETTEVKNEIS